METKEQKVDEVTKVEETDENGEEYQSKLKNLNKGISKYRRESAEKDARIAKLEAQLNGGTEKKVDSKKEAEDDDDDDAEISKADQKKLEKWAKKNGYATKQDIEAERTRIQQESLKNIESQAIDEFLKKHPAYDDDDEWGKVLAEFAMYKQPTTIAGYRKVLNKIHKELNPGSDDKEDEVRARAHTRKRLGFGGGSQRTDDAGGGEATLDELAERYPSLSRDQIKSRLSELKKLHDKK